MLQLGVTDYDEGDGSVEELASGAPLVTQASMNPQSPVNIFFELSSGTIAF